MYKLTEYGIGLILYSIDGYLRLHFKNRKYLLLSKDENRILALPPTSQI